MVVAAPLLVLGRPEVVLLRAIRAGTLQKIVATVRHARVASWAGLATNA